MQHGTPSDVDVEAENFHGSLLQTDALSIAASPACDRRRQQAELVPASLAPLCASLLHPLLLSCHPVQIDLNSSPRCPSKNWLFTMLLPTARAPLRLPECRHVADDAPRFGCFRIKRQRAAKAHASGSGNEEPVSEAIDAGAEAEAVHGEPAGLPSLYEQSVTAARTKRLGVGISATFMAVSLVAATQIGILPAPSAEALALPLGCVGVLGMGAAAAFWAANGGRVHVEWHENRMWVETGVPPDASLQPLPVGSIQVRTIPSCLRT